MIIQIPRNKKTNLPEAVMEQTSIFKLNSVIINKEFVEEKRVGNCWTLRL